LPPRPAIGHLTSQLDQIFFKKPGDSRRQEFQPHPGHHLDLADTTLVVTITSSVPWCLVHSTNDGDKPRANRAGQLAVSPTSLIGRYCCKSPILFGTDFFVRKQKLLRSPINRAPNSFPGSPVSLSPGNEVPHIFTQKSRQQPRKILVSSGRALLQQNRPVCEISRTCKKGAGHCGNADSIRSS
jgi:hypothetical protein